MTKVLHPRITSLCTRSGGWLIMRILITVKKPTEQQRGKKGHTVIKQKPRPESKACFITANHNARQR